MTAQKQTLNSLRPLQWGGLFALLTFSSGSFTYILSSRVTHGSYSFVGMPIGIASLFFLFGTGLFIAKWGSGGTKCWEAYPTVIWLIGFGG